MVFMGMCIWVIGLLRTNVYVFFREYYGIRLLYAWHPVARSHNCRIKGLFPPCSSVPLVPLRQTLRGHLPSIWTEPAHTSLPDCSRATEVTDMKVIAVNKHQQTILGQWHCMRESMLVDATYAELKRLCTKRLCTELSCSTAPSLARLPGWPKS